MALLKHAFRQLVLHPGLSATMIAMLALGIGAATAIFALFYQALVQPLPVPEAKQLVNIVRAGTGPAYRGQAVSYSMFNDLDAGQTVFNGIAGYSSFTAHLAYGEQALSLRGAFVSAEYFSVLGLQAAVGRLIGPQDVPRIGESAVVVLSHDLWQTRFGGDPDIVGRSLKINGQVLTVIGVAPARFSGTQVGVRMQVFAPITMRWRLIPVSGVDTPENRNFNWVRSFARLRSGVSVEQAAAGLNTVYARIRREIEAPLHSLSGEKLRQFLSARLELTPGARGQGSIRGAGQPLTLLLGITLLVLLIVGVNVANLLLVRGASRMGEMAIRESIGASRGRLVAELLAETTLPAALGGILALLLAAMTLAAVRPILPSRLAEGLGMHLGGTSALFAALATVATATVFGLVPALRTVRTDPALAMKGHAAQALGGGGAKRLRGGLATAQIAFSMVLLVLAGLFAQSLRNVARIDLGMDVDSLVSFSVSPRLNGYDSERTLVLYQRIGQALAAQPGVSGVAAAAVPVISGSDFETNMSVEGFDNGGKPSSANINMVGKSFFETLGIPLLAGRAFTSADIEGSSPVAIVNERFAREYGLDGHAMGKHIKWGSASLEIVGVIANAAYSEVKAAVPPQFFVPLGSLKSDNLFSVLASSASFYVRAAVDPETLVRVIPQVIASIDPALPVTHVITMRRQVQQDIFVDRLVAILSASFAALATLLAAVGLYGVLAYSVAARTRELGLRLALGAEPADLRFMMLKQVGGMALIGLVVGLAAAIGAGRAAEALLYGLSGHDPFVLAGAAVALAAVVLAASYWPARRASNIAPMEALRHE